jgi:hypothetical protein
MGEIDSDFADGSRALATFFPREQNLGTLNIIDRDYDSKYSEYYSDFEEPMDDLLRGFEHNTGIGVVGLSNRDGAVATLNYYSTRKWFAPLI